MQEKKRILAVDYGERRIGLAISDAFQWTARPLETIDRKKSPDTASLIHRIILENDVGEIVVGMPFNMDGTKGESSERVENFVKMLKKIVTCPIFFEDERCTTLLAHEIIREMGYNKRIRKRKGKVDQMAAVLILKSYISKKEM
ncbi:MAG: Holliday junction resolvase RuvX [Candidatus Cloacimonetes bacterium 4572_55]|nr:MAG: Holliday junction resolvase RuvX [Candidatus Cloacimonetes bacterium 4572_55]